MAISYDDKGNPQVDFVWGTTPLQPDDVRVESSVEATLDVIAISDYASSIGIFTANGSQADFKAGDVVTVVGTGTNSDGEYVVQYAMPNSPTGLVLACNYRSFTHLGVSPWADMPAGVKVYKSDAGNFGGGAGDKGWSRTTKNKSLKLDPALDGHNIATAFWNNFPGNTPNAGFVPQEVFRFTVSSTYSVGVETEVNYDEPYTGNRYGYIFNLYSNALDTEKAAELVALISANALAGERVPSVSYQDSYGNTKTLPEGWVVGADYTPGAYSGEYGFTIQVATATPNEWGQTEYPAVGTEIVIGVGAPKSLVWQGVNGTDYNVAFIQGSAYGGPANVVLYGLGASLTPLADLVNSGALVGALVGLGINNDNQQAYNSGDAYYAARNLIKVATANVSYDGYGNPYVTLTAADGGWGPYYNFTDVVDGDTVVIVK